MILLPPDLFQRLPCSVLSCSLTLLSNIAFTEPLLCIFVLHASGRTTRDSGYHHMDGMDGADHAAPRLCTLLSLLHAVPGT